MADIIQLLPDHVANQIAAGEVVQRPASLVKELLENAIDAKATSIKLLIKDAGKTLVQVIDNGTGMTKADAQFCFERHATSKIKIAEDLFNIHTKGFRGEALASIAAIAHVELKTKTDKDEIGTHITIEGSSIRSQVPAVVPVGSSISVKNLFYNIPARRNFLKSNPVETRHIIDEFHRVALAHPNVEFILINNQSTVFNLPPSNIRQRIVNILGAKTNEKLVPVSEETEIVKVDGFIVKPEFSKKSRGEQFFFVNNRFIKSSYLHHAILSSFEGLLKEGNQPGYFLFLDVDPQTIDINIHPTKTEIKFDDEHAIYAMLRASIKHSLGQFSIVPSLDFNKDPEMDTPYDLSKKSPAAPNIEVDKSFNPFLENKKQRDNFNAYTTKNTTTNVNSWEAMYVGLNNDQDDIDFDTIEFESDEVTGALFESEQTSSNDFIFQLQNKYIMSPIKSGIMIIHQNLAHQRILYEDFLKSIFESSADSQKLAFPIEINLSKQQLLMFNKIDSEFKSLGFEFGLVENLLEITSLPNQLKNNSIEEIIDDILDNDFDKSNSLSHSDFFAKALSKSSSIKSGEKLNSNEQEFLVNQLFSCKEPNLSPYNKQIFITLSKNDIENIF